MSLSVRGLSFLEKTGENVSSHLFLRRFIKVVVSATILVLLESLAALTTTP
jgi:hypothetical protein